MKLNLLPANVSKEGAVKGAVVGSIVIFVIGVLIAVALIFKSSKDLSNATSAYDDAMARANQADSQSKQADAILGETDVASLVRNVNLAKAMNAHSAVYPALYSKVKMYIPGFYRVTSMSASPIDDATCTVTLSGVISSYQQYADLMLALWRIPGATAVSRSAIVPNLPSVPALSTDDQTGSAYLPGEGPLPSDPLKRLDFLRSLGKTPGYDGAGNFGSDPSLARGAEPNAYTVTVQIVMPGSLKTPDPRATLSTAPAASAAVASTTGAPTGPGGPGPAGPGGPSADPGGTAANRAANNKDDN